MKHLVIIDSSKQTRKVVPECGQDIGRGKFLEIAAKTSTIIFQCDDKRVSRTHGRITKEVKDNKLLLRLESLHLNPIFCRKKDGTTDYTLKKDEGILLEIGDKFKLIVDGVWFEVGEDVTETDSQRTAMSLEDENQNNPSGDTTPCKRKHDAEQADDQSKRQRILGENERNDEPSTSTQLPADSEQMTVPDSSSAGIEAPVEIKPDPDSLPTDGSTTQVLIKAEPNADTNDAGCSGNGVAMGGQLPQLTLKPDPDGLGAKVAIPVPTFPVVANPGVLRPSCDYGIRCYRAGQDHRSMYAHPGDFDYRRPSFPPPPPGSPLCPFGARCYRRNPQHFREYDHPDPNADLLLIRPVRRAAPRRQADDNMSDDELPYESEPDFDDSSSDEYLPGRMDDESDELGSAEEDNDSGLDC
uniref:PBZ-type domain-containing protein n=1 Tax=Anopheles epiroticus TaxID=199890 RepID=A0A182PP61_9DIPT